MRSICLWALLHYSFVCLPPALTQLHNPPENHISAHKTVICNLSLCVAEAARAKITTWNLFFPLLITVTDPSLSTAERRGPQVHPAIQDG